MEEARRQTEETGQLIVDYLSMSDEDRAQVLIGALEQVQLADAFLPNQARSGFSAQDVFEHAFGFSPSAVGDQFSREVVELISSENDWLNPLD